MRPPEKILWEHMEIVFNFISFGLPLYTKAIKVIGERELIIKLEF